MKILGKVKKVLVSIILILAILATASIAKSSISEPFRNRLEKTIEEIAEIKNMNIIGLGNDSASELDENLESDNQGENPNQTEGSTSSDTLEDAEPAKDDETYNVQIELKIVDEDGEGIIEGSKLKVTDITNQENVDGESATKSDLEIKILNFSTGTQIQTEENGEFDTDGQGVVVDLNKLKKNKKYKIQIDDIESAEGYLRTINSLVLEVSIDDDENIVAKIANVTNTSDDENDGTEQANVNLHGAGKDGTVTIKKGEDDPSTQIMYMIRDNVTDEGLSEKTEDVAGDEQWHEYSGNVEVTKNSEIHAKAIKKGQDSEISVKIINNIDKKEPELKEFTQNAEGDARKISITVQLEDDASGIAKYGISRSDKIQPDTYIKADESITDEDIEAHRSEKPIKNVEGTIDEIYENGKYYIWIWDMAGNCKVKEIEITQVKEIVVAEIVETSSEEKHDELVGSQYKSLYSAIQACPEGEQTTIRILAEILNENNVIDNRDITLNLNGNKVNNKSSNRPNLTVNGNASLTIINIYDGGANQVEGAISSENSSGILVKQGGTLTLRKR